MGVQQCCGEDNNNLWSLAIHKQVLRRRSRQPPYARLRARAGHVELRPATLENVARRKEQGAAKVGAAIALMLVARLGGRGQLTAA